VKGVRGLLALSLISCGPPGPREVRGPDDGKKPAPAARAPSIVASEQAHRGSRLILVDEVGRRVRELTDPPSSPSADMGPAFSPDGRFVAYASSRGRGDPRLTSLWIVPVAGGEPARLTDDAGIDVQPAFAPDGKSLVFASTRGGGGQLDLFHLELEAGDGPPRSGALRRLTSEPGAELMPAISPDGRTIAHVTAETSREKRIVLRDAAGGAARVLTDGEAPAFAPDGTWLAFAARAEGREDLDLHGIALDGTNRRRLVAGEVADETAPRFSRDGRFLLATAVLRDDAGKALLSTLVYLETDDPAPHLRALQEPIPSSRNGCDVGPGALDAGLLRANPTYADALRRVLVQ
jgi:Tol biopolymer transport system component